MNEPLKCTIVWQKNWDAIHKVCDTCNGSGLVDGISCSWCGDGETIGSRGSGKYYKYVVNKGSSRSSKTVSLIDLYDLYARSHQNKRLTVWRDTKISCKKTVLNDTIKRLRSTGRYKVGQDFNKTESIFTYETGSTFEIHGTDDEESVHGLTQDMAWLNEPYKISADTFRQLDMRTADFVFVDLNPKKGHWTDDISKDKRACVIHSTFKDNPFCPINMKLTILAKQPISYSEVVQLGLISEHSAREYDLISNNLNFSKSQLLELSRCRENEDKRSADEFEWQVYGLGLKAEIPHRIFRWKEISLQDYLDKDLKIYIGNDWGVVDPWGIVECKYKDGDLFVRELNYKSENILRAQMSSTEQLSIESKKDGSEEGNEGIVTWLFAKLGISKKLDIICDTNRPIKIRSLRMAGYGQAKGANKPKGSILDGIDILSNLNVYFTSDSENLRYEQENYSRKVDKFGEADEDPEDDNNHLIDAIRYVVLHLKRIGVIKSF